MAAAVVVLAAMFLFLLHLVIHIQAVHVMDRLNVKKYLQRYGYINHHNDAETISSRMLKFGIRRYQLTHGLPVTGRIDNHTLNLMATPRCGVTDLGIRSTRRHNSINGTGQSTYNLFPGNPKWRHYNLMYRYEVNDELPSHIDYESAINRAFRRWEAICLFNFQQVPDYYMPDPGLEEEVQGDILIGWHAGEHGDGFPFDGRGTVVAHASPPTAGMLHFDADETWTAREKVEVWPYEVDLESVAVHEIGHLLGLRHSNVQDAIMYPYTDYGKVKRELQSDDIQGLKELYTPFCNLVEINGD
ncbi:Metalloendoproteinase 5-MMP [Linum grandiflorum]